MDRKGHWWFDDTPENLTLTRSLLKDNYMVKV